MALTQRSITLPAVGKTYSLGSYIKAIKLAKANPDVKFDHGLTTWWPTTGRQVVAQFVDGMLDRISQAIPYNQRGVV